MIDLSRLSNKHEKTRDGYRVPKQEELRSVVNGKRGNLLAALNMSSKEWQDIAFDGPPAGLGPDVAKAVLRKAREFIIEYRCGILPPGQKFYTAYAVQGLYPLDGPKVVDNR